MEKCHLTIKLNSQVDKNDQDISYWINFCEDNTMAKPKFIKNSSVEHTIQSRWITPCSISVKSNDKNAQTENNYNAYYHPMTYQLAKNQEFKRIIIENAIESLCVKKKLIMEFNYDVVSSVNNYLGENDIFSKPQYCLSLFSSISNQKFIQLIIWLPLIISSNAIIIETSKTNFYLQTEKPHKYELNLLWPDEVRNFHICFCNFLKNERRLIFVAEYCEIPVIGMSKFDEMSDKENKSPLISNRSFYACNNSQLCLPTPDLLGLYSDSIGCPNASDNEGHIMCELLSHCNSNDSEEVESSGEQDTSVLEAQVSVSQNEYPLVLPSISCGAVNAKKAYKVKFNSFNCCLVFEDVKPVSEINARPGHKVPMKTNDGCSAKKFNYQQNKSQKINREKGNKSSRAKRNSNKKKK